MATKNDIAALVNHMILWTRDGKLQWNSTNAEDLVLSIPDDSEIDGLIYTSVLNQEHFRIYRLAPKQPSRVPLNIMLTRGMYVETKKSPVYKLQIFKEYPATVLFEFPSLSQLADLYKEASKRVFDIEKFVSQLKDLDSTVDES